ncbi:MAG: RNA polymerase sigma factor [Lachnospiraceae bacterium]|nr:RNA polymerase sigma factor [Lachnospiraceae bacterium]
MNDEILVQQLKQGSHEAFDLLYEKYKNLVIRTAYLITGNQPDSEDAAQETFVKVYLHITELKNNAGFKPWMMQILVRTAYRMGKKKSREVPDEEIEHLSENKSILSPLGHVIKREEAEMISRAVAALPVKQRAVVVLYYYNELSVGEIAKMLGCREGTVKSRLHTARKYLKGKLESTADIREDLV